MIIPVEKGSVAVGCSDPMLGSRQVMRSGRSESVLVMDHKTKAFPVIWYTLLRCQLLVFSC